MQCIVLLMMLISGPTTPLEGPKWEKPMVTYMDCSFDGRNVYVCKP